jgi:hypothetical protein
MANRQSQVSKLHVKNPLEKKNYMKTFSSVAVAMKN